MAGRVIHRRAGEGAATLECGGDLLVFKGRREDGLGSLFMELTCPPGGGPPPHTDPSEELLYVLEGDFEFLAPTADGVLTYRAGPGDSVVVPARAPHTYRNVGSSNARMIVFFRDNENMQPFFEELGEPAEAEGWESSGPPPIEKAIAAAQRHGIEPVMPGRPS